MPTAARPPGTATDTCVVIGTPDTVRQALALLRLARSAPSPVGYILPDAAEPVGAGCRFLGSLQGLEHARDALGVRVAIVSLPSAMSATIARVRRALQQLNIEERFVPPIHELLTTAPPYTVGFAATPSAHQASPPRGINPATLIGRAPRPLDHAAVERLVAGRRVLITGAGGSIGSHLAHLVASFGPQGLLLMDRSENALFDIDRGIARAQPGVPRRAILHDVVDAHHTRSLLARHRPDIVFHAAAHKHVPLMEDHPAAAVSNNVFGTRAVADAAIAAGCERFVLVSTDKAVNPASVMGATKRLAEQYVLALHQRAHAGLLAHAASRPMRCAVVRFGNVLGSSCSVLQIWNAQIAEGGPITVTDPEMTRYFMTIPEAASLVVQAATVDTGASPGLFVLDMGAPVRILDLAVRFANAHGFDLEGFPSDPPRPTVPLLITGRRPGEKLHEELAHDAESMAPSPVPGVFAWRGPLPDPARIDAHLDALRRAIADDDNASVLRALSLCVPSLRRAA